MTHTETLRLALEALGWTDEWRPQGLKEEAITAIKAALEAKDEKDGSPCPEFWDWLPKAYRNGDADDLPKFTKYNMEVSFLAGKQSAALEAKDEPVATDWERIARVQNAKLMAVCDGAGGFEKLCEVMDKYEAITPTQRKPLTDEEIVAIVREASRGSAIRRDGSTSLRIARAIEAAHGIRGEV